MEYICYEGPHPSPGGRNSFPWEYPVRLYVTMYVRRFVNTELGKVG